MAEKLKQGDSLATEIFDKFNRLVDEVNGMEGGGSLTAEAIKDALGYTPVDNAGVSKLFSQLTTDIDNGLVQAGYAKNSDKLDGKDSSYYLDYNNLSNKPSGGGSSGGTGGGGDAIIDVNFLPGNITKVVALPTENIDKNARYGVIKVNSLVGGVKNQMPNPSTHFDFLSGIPITVRVVEELPANPEYASVDINAPTEFILYYKPNGGKLFQTNDDRLYAYIPAGGYFNNMTDHPNDEWIRASTFFSQYLYITSDSFVGKEEDIPYPDRHNRIAFMLSYDCYQYDGTTWKSLGESDGNEAINKKAFYRVKTDEKVEVYLTANGMKDMIEGPVVWTITNELPSVGKPFIDNENMCYNLYFVPSEKMVYGYSVTIGWHDFQYLFTEVVGDGSAHGGIFSADEAPEFEPNKVYAIYSIKEVYSLYYYKNGWHEVGGKPIVDVDELPTTGIDEKVFYRTPKKSDVFMTSIMGKDMFLSIAGNTLAPVKWVVVNELPEVGELFLNMSTGGWNVYFRDKDKTAHLYLGPFAQEMGRNEEWLTFEEGIALMAGSIPVDGVTICTTDELATIDTKKKILIVYTPQEGVDISHYKDGWHKVGNGGSMVRITASSMESVGFLLDDDVIDVFYDGTITVDDYNVSGKHTFTVFKDTEMDAYCLKAQMLADTYMVTLFLTYANHGADLWVDYGGRDFVKGMSISGSSYTLNPETIIVRKFKRG